MKRTFSILFLVLLCTLDALAGRPGKSVADTLELSDAFLDTVTVYKQSSINDYTLIGGNYGYTLSNTDFNPAKHNRKWVGTPNYASAMYTRYGKMFQYMPYFGLQVGAFYESEGYSFKKDKETGKSTYLESGADNALIHVALLRGEAGKAGITVRSSYNETACGINEEFGLSYLNYFISL